MLRDHGRNPRQPTSLWWSPPYPSLHKLRDLPDVKLLGQAQWKGGKSNSVLCPTSCFSHYSQFLLCVVHNRVGRMRTQDHCALEVMDLHEKALWLASSPSWHNPSFSSFLHGQGQDGANGRLFFPLMAFYSPSSAFATSRSIRFLLFLFTADTHPIHQTHKQGHTCNIKPNAFYAPHSNCCKHVSHGSLGYSALHF